MRKFSFWRSKEANILVSNSWIKKEQRAQRAGTNRSAIFPIGVGILPVSCSLRGHHFKVTHHCILQLAWRWQRWLVQSQTRCRIPLHTHHSDSGPCSSQNFFSASFFHSCGRATHFCKVGCNRNVGISPTSTLSRTPCKKSLLCLSGLRLFPTFHMTRNLRKLWNALSVPHIHRICTVLWWVYVLPRAFLPLWELLRKNGFRRDGEVVCRITKAIFLNG